MPMRPRARTVFPRHATQEAQADPLEEQFHITRLAVHVEPAIRDIVIYNLSSPHFLFEAEEKISAYHIFRRIGVFVLGIEEFHYVEAASIHIKMNISLFKIRGNGFPNFCVRVQLFNFFPNSLSHTTTLRSIFYIEEIKMIALCFFVNYNDSSTNHLTIHNRFVSKCPFF